MTNEELLRLYETLNRITNNKDLVFPIKIGYYFAKNKAAIREEAMLIYTTRQEIMLKYGELQENGDIIVQKQDIKDMKKELDEIMKIQNNTPITQILITDFDKSQLPLEDIEGLMPILQEPWITGPPIFENNTGD